MRRQAVFARLRGLALEVQGKRAALNCAQAWVAGGGQGGVSPPGTAHGTCHAPYGRMSDSAHPCGAAGKRSLFFKLPGEDRSLPTPRETSLQIAQRSREKPREQLAALQVRRGISNLAAADFPHLCSEEHLKTPRRWGAG